MEVEIPVGTIVTVPERGARVRRTVIGTLKKGDQVYVVVLDPVIHKSVEYHIRDVGETGDMSPRLVR